MYIAKISGWLGKQLWRIFKIHCERWKKLIQVSNYMKVCKWRQDFHFWVNCTKTQFLPQQPMEVLQSRGFIGHHRLFGKTATYHVTDFQFSRASWRGRAGEQSASPPQTHRDSISQLHAPAHYPWPVVSNQSSASENPGSFVFRADLRKPPTQKLLRLTNADTKPPFFFCTVKQKMRSVARFPHRCVLWGMRTL